MGLITSDKRCIFMHAHVLRNGIFLFKLCIFCLWIIHVLGSYVWSLLIINIIIIHLRYKRNTHCQGTQKIFHFINISLIYKLIKRHKTYHSSDSFDKHLIKFTLGLYCYIRWIPNATFHDAKDAENITFLNILTTLNIKM